MSKQLPKYLRSCAVSDLWQIQGSERSAIRAAIVIPALAEADTLPQTLASLTTNPLKDLSQTLVLIVVNNRADASDEQKCENLRTLHWLQSTPHPELNLAWIDASSPGMELPAGQGVGLARKIGFDLVLSRLAWGENPLLVSLDADTRVGSDYLPALFRHFEQTQEGGAVLPFRHRQGETAAEERAIRRYELYLRSYVFGLQQAGSPYAYHTIGSALACTAAAYVAVGGMNRRRAAEDFYFLQQLAKSCGVAPLAGTVVSPSPRFSDRVPFGTGRVVQAQVERQTALFKLCPVEAFQVLKEWLLLVESGWQMPAGTLLEAAGSMDQRLPAFLEQLNFSKNWRKLQQQHRERGRFLQAFHGWFDGLRTRQLLSGWAAEISPEQELQLVGELLRWGGLPVPDDLDGQLGLLEQQQL